MFSESTHDKINKLLLRIKNGETEAMEELFSLTSAHLLGVARIYLNNKYLDEEVVSEAFMRIGKGISRYNGAYSGYNWMRKIVKNVALSVNRKEGRFTLQFDAEQVENIPAKEDLIESARTRLDIREAISHLDEIDRKIFEAIYYEDKSQREIAKQLHITESAVSQRKNKIKFFLDKYYKNS